MTFENSSLTTLEDGGEKTAFGDRMSARQLKPSFDIAALTVRPSLCDCEPHGIAVPGDERYVIPCRRQTWLPGKVRSILFPLNSSALVWDNTSNLVLAPKNPNRLSATRSMVLPSNYWIIRPGRLPP